MARHQRQRIYELRQWLIRYRPPPELALHSQCQQTDAKDRDDGESWKVSASAASEADGNPLCTPGKP